MPFVGKDCSRIIWVPIGFNTALPKLKVSNKLPDGVPKINDISVAFCDDRSPHPHGMIVPQSGPYSILSLEEAYWHQTHPV
jgi:hypothetical protein